MHSYSEHATPDALNRCLAASMSVPSTSISPAKSNISIDEETA
jgi:hypothetical protein